MLVVVILIMVMVVVMMLVFVLVRVGHVGSASLGQQLGDQVALAVHDGDDLCAGQGGPVGGHDGGGGVLFPQHCHGSGDLFLAGGLGAAEQDAACVADLVVVELAKVFHIHFDLVHVGDGDKAVQDDRQALGHALHSAGNVGQFTNTRRLDEDAVGVELLHDLAQRLVEIAHQRAADAAGGHLGDLDAGLLEEAAVDVDLTEFVFDQHELFARVGFGNELFDERRFAGAEKTGENVNFCHGGIRFLFLDFTKLLLYARVVNDSSPSRAKSSFFAQKMSDATAAGPRGGAAASRGRSRQGCACRWR